MKKTIQLLSLILLTLSTSAKEGMWPPFLLKYIAKDLRESGLQISTEQLYSEEQSSLKDAVVIFGGGCTGEIISSQGLVLTNHHCGYGTVQGLSDVSTNYLLDGFFAKSVQEEIPCPGLKVRVIEKYEDITNQILNFDANALSAEQKDSIIKINTKTILDEHKDNENIEYRISNFYQGNQYFLISYTVYRDVRLVAFPPNGIGKFGGDTDNWAWPRHTGDFGLFRVYTGTDNQPSDYATTNIPLKPKKFLTLDVDGAKPGEFSMVYGFPGRTTEYISSYEMSNIQKVIDPSRIDCRGAKLNVWNKAMKESEETFVKYASKQARVANYWKKWMGEVQGLENNDVLSIKRGREKMLQNRLHEMDRSAPELDSLKNLMESSQDLLVAYYYYVEALKGIEIYSVADNFRKLESAVAEGKDKDSLIAASRTYLLGFYKNYDRVIDQEATIALFNLYKKNVPINLQFAKIKNSEDVKSNLSKIFSETKLTNLAGANALLDEYEKTGDFKSISSDVAYAWSASVHNYYIESLKPAITSYSAKKNQWNKALMTNYYDAFNSSKPVFPDANSTLRIAYGKVEGVQAEDGVEYTYTTTLDGAVRKANPEVEEFNAPQRLIDIHANKDYGKYAVNGKVPVCFLASNHTTGGNSGSPVLNSKGHLIGLNFDRIWQGTMSDLYFDESICRNISVHIRYVLFLLDKYGEAAWLLDEMDIVGEGF